MSELFFQRLLTEQEVKYGWVGVNADQKSQELFDTWVRSNILRSEMMDEDSDPFHITVKYGLHTRDATEVESVMRMYPRSIIKARLMTISLFEHPKQDVIKIGVDSPDLLELNRIITSNLEVTDTYPKYVPHLTLAYVGKGFGKKYVGSNIFSGRVLEFREVFFSTPEKEVTIFLLT